MQINGVGGGQVRDSYQKPNQAPNTTANKKETDEANKRLEALGVRVELSSQQKNVQESKPVQTQEDPKTRDEKFSLFEILKTLWEEGKKLIRDIWYGDSEGTAGRDTVDSGAEGQSTAEQHSEDAGIKVREISSEIQGPEVPDGSVRVKEVQEAVTESNAQWAVAAEDGSSIQERMTAGEPVPGEAQQMSAADLDPAEVQQMSATELDPAEIAAAAAAVVPHAELRNGENPVVAESAARQQETIWEKIRTKIREIAGQLMGNIWGESPGFDTQTSFQSQEEKAKEEPAKKNEFGVELPELEGKPLHTSHLQDSYNKYGQYSKLAQDPQSSMSLRK